MPRGIDPDRTPAWTRRQLIDGIRWRTRTGAPWRDVPERYGPWDQVYDLFRRWQRNGTWARIVTQLQAQADAKRLITWDVSVDSTVCRTHQHAAGAAKGGPAKESPRSGCSQRFNWRVGCPTLVSRPSTHLVAPCTSETVGAWRYAPAATGCSVAGAQTRK
ncbi:transposase [Streptomyces sp. NPDC055692]|uniref:transposase n=1 Tax=Streptomyces sp. NPDC055692 TaxID=3155683 RepID=UPI0034444F63